MSGQAITEQQVLELLHGRGATRVRRIRFQANRRTIWSLTQGGTVLNMHVAYRAAPLEILAYFAVIAREARERTDMFHAAAAIVRAWEGLEAELARIRREHGRTSGRRRTTAKRRSRGIGPCCATPEQKVYLERLFGHLNRTRFEGRLPAGIPLRLSNRMRSRLGQMVPRTRNGVREVAELALNVDLMLEGNGAERLETFVHEMAHAADWLFSGHAGHGPTWRGWARYAGCRERACTNQPILRRGPGVRRVTRVPPLPGEAGEQLTLI